MGSLIRDVEQTGSGRSETEAERLDRNYGELLQELRVAQTGVQILFAFLLTLAFSARFEETTSFQRGVYVVTLLVSAGAAALLIAPVAFHRLVFRRRLKASLVDAANRMALGGLALLLLGIVGSVLLILDVVLGHLPAALLTAVVTVWMVVLWVVIPVTARSQLPDRRGANGESGSDRR